MPEDRRHAAIMFTDIVGYTALIDRDKGIALVKQTQEELSANRTLYYIDFK